VAIWNSGIEKIVPVNGRGYGFSVSIEASNRTSFRRVFVPENTRISSVRTTLSMKYDDGILIKKWMYRCGFFYLGRKEGFVVDVTFAEPFVSAELRIALDGDPDNAIRVEWEHMRRGGWLGRAVKRLLRSPNVPPEALIPHILDSDAKKGTECASP
jgi:hypothetical protein